MLKRPGHWAKEPLLAVDYIPLRQHLGLEDRIILTTLAGITSILSDSLKRDRERAQTGRAGEWTTVDDHAVRLLDRIWLLEAVLHGENLGIMPLVTTPRAS